MDEFKQIDTTCVGMPEENVYSDMIQSIVSEDFDFKTGVKKIKQLDDSDKVRENIQMRLVDVHSQQKHASVAHGSIPHVEDSMSKAPRKTIMQNWDRTSFGSMHEIEPPRWYYDFGKHTRNREENDANADQEKRYYSDSGINSPIISSPRTIPDPKVSVDEEISLNDDLDTLKPTSTSTEFYYKQGLDPEEIDMLEELMGPDYWKESETEQNKIVSNWESPKRETRQPKLKRRDTGDFGINSLNDTPDPALTKHRPIYRRHLVNPLTKIRMDEEHNKVPTHDLDTPTPTNDSNGFHLAQAQLSALTQFSDLPISNILISDSEQKAQSFRAESQAQVLNAPSVKRCNVQVSSFRQQKPTLYKLWPSSTLEQDRLWIKCIALNEKAYGYRAIRNNILPSRQMLDDLIDHFGRKSKLVLSTCDKICTVMKSSSEQIVDVWPAMRAKDMQVTFIVIVKDELESVRLRAFTDYYFVKRRIHEVSSEGKEVIYSTQFDIGLAKITSEESENITRSINLINNDMVRKHTQLTMISGSPVRSKGYNTSSHSIDAEPCIVLYVSVKGYFPIQEDPFDSHYHGISVDVREGLAYLFTEYADSYHSNLKIGCQITKNRVGTLGGFLDYHGFGTCGLTSAHVLLDQEEMRNLAQGYGSKDWRIPTSDQTVFQPNNDLSEQSRKRRDHSAGKLVKAIYKEGGGGESGLDIAIFQVEKRFPVSGCFPTPKAGSHLDISFDSGKTAGYSRLKFGAVTKFGAATDFTRGTVSMDGPNLSVKAIYENIELFKDFKITLHNLIEVKTADISPTGELLPFAQPGDSGALVFCKGEEDELFCVGIVEGGTTSGTCFIMPIAPVLEELKLSGLKSFEKHRIFEHINTLRTEIRHGQYNMTVAFQTIDQKLDLLFRSVNERLHN